MSLSLLLARRQPIPTSRCTASSGSTLPALLARRYAQPASPPPPPFPSSSSTGSASQPSNWKPKPVLATAQTLTLFSESPQGLLIALRSTLQGMTNLASRLGPLSASAAGAGPSSSRPGLNGDSSSSETVAAGSDHVLLYSLSKDLPQEYLGEAVALLRGTKDATYEDGKDGPAASRIARVGLLSSPLPTSLIPSNALDPGATRPQSPTLHSVALSLLPGINAVPFRSEIPGRAEVAVGRWPDRKPSWQQGAERRADHLDLPPGKAEAERDRVKDGQNQATTGSDQPKQRDWRDVWGRENVEGRIPSELEALEPSSVLSLLFFTDPSPQGLVEGISANFPNASVVGLQAPPTPFETGRDQTLLLTLPSSGKAGADRIFQEGAVGVALVANVDAQGQTGAGAIARPKVETSTEGLVAFGPRREVTSASGNIITELAGQNAAQQFLRDIQTRSVSSSSASLDSLSTSETREIAAKVKKEEEFYIAFFASPSGGAPLLVSPILSGHPSRGTLSVDTDIDLGRGAHANASEQTRQPSGATDKIYAQFLQPSVPSASGAGEGSGVVEPIEIPGPDPSVWVAPRYMFLSLPPSALPSGASSPAVMEAGGKEGKGKHQVFALPNLFVAASEKGWYAGSGKRGGGSGSSISLQADGSSTVECKVPKARVVLSLRGE